MSAKYLIIFNSDILFEIFDEIKDKLDFNLIRADEENLDKLDLSKHQNYLVISQNKCAVENFILIDNLPKKLSKILEQINIEFLSKKYAYQSSILIGKYVLDFNSRTINFKDIKVDLTEREVDLINFIKNNQKVSLKELQKNVWNFTSELETHTVETHIYRLRKKFIDNFSDNNFIKHDKKGYYIN